MRAVLAIAAITLVIGLAGAGTGFLGGDPAVYAAQALQGDLSERTVHVGYLAVAVVLGRLAGEALPLWLDALTALCAAATVVVVGSLVREGRPWVAAAVTAAVVLPRASFAEVDAVWLLLVLVAARVPPRWAVVAAGSSVLVSPVALLALPWAAVVRKDWRPVAAGAAIAVLGVTLATRGAWWVGDRGVLAGPPLDPLRTLEAVAWALPWFAVPFARRDLVAVLPLLLAPADVPVGHVVGVSLALGAARGRYGVAVVMLQAVVGLYGWNATMTRVFEEEAVTAATLDAMAPEDTLLATWSWGARASVRATGDPYRLPWRVPGEPVRGRALCDRTSGRLWLLPPDLRPDATRERATAWIPAAIVADLPGCASPSE